jgi:hypothetical protein
VVTYWPTAVVVLAAPFPQPDMAKASAAELTRAAVILGFMSFFLDRDRGFGR